MKNLKTMFFLVFTLVSCSTAIVNNRHPMQLTVKKAIEERNMDTMKNVSLKNDLGKGVIFSVGEKFPSANFNGTVWLKMLTSQNSAQPIANVTFEPGCRNSWHYHAGGQILLVTGGRGYYQEWGKEARELHEGDVVEIPANVKHWHGASKDSWFAHLAIEVHPEKGGATWLEPVADDVYNKLK